MTTFIGQTLERIPSDASTRVTIGLGGNGSAPAVGDGYVAASIFDKGSVEVFPFDGLFIGDVVSYDVGQNANVVTYGFGAFWATNTTSGEVWRIDPVAGTAEAVTMIPGALGISAGDDMIYVASFPTGNVYQFPPDNPASMNDLVSVGNNAFEVAYGTPG